MNPKNLPDVTGAPGANHLTWADFTGFLGSRFCYWVYDFDHMRVIWANEPALSLWASPDIETLSRRDLSADMSDSVKARLEQFRIDIGRGAVFDEMWTLYPEGNPHPLQVRFRGCKTPDGRLAMMCEGAPLEVQSAELIRISHALLFTDAMVSIYSDTGECLYGNPAARRSFMTAFPRLADRVLNPDFLNRLKSSDSSKVEGRFVSMAQTAKGFRLHEVEARLSIDPITGRRSTLLTEIDITEQEEAKARLAYLAEHDPLTGLGNRSHLESMAKEVLGAARVSDEAVVLMVLDMDRFKLINDTLGHEAGDKFLKGAARRLRSALPHHAIVSRLGGDEFCVLLHQPAMEAGNLRLPRAVERSLSRPMVVDGHSLSLRTSIGIAISPGKSAPTMEMLLRDADMALAVAKRRQDNEPVIYRPEMADESLKFLNIDRKIKSAIKAKRMMLLYQPRISVQTGRIVGAEALLRLFDADGSVMSPDSFIPVAEASGSILPLGRWVIRTAAAELLRLSSEGFDLQLSVNVSPRQFVDPALLPLLRKVGQALPRGPAQLELEITEGMLASDDTRAVRNIARVGELGYRLAIDDFGTAYSNIVSLKRYPIHCLKIDRTIISHESAELLATGVVTIARSIGANVVAEGVENYAQLEFLKRIGCEEYQGYLYSKPVSRDRFVELLKAQG
jgi:diguanylate cyclase (GGDEF)-like protein